MANQIPLTQLILDPEEERLRTTVRQQWYLSQDLNHLYRALRPNSAIRGSRFVAYLRTAASRERGGDGLIERWATYFEYDPTPFEIKGIPSTANRAYIISADTTYSAALHPTW